MNMSVSQARVIDPILTTVAQGYQNAEMVASYLFPKVPVDARGGQIIQFGKEDFMLYNTARAPGSTTKRMQVGYFGNKFALDSHSLEGVVPFEIMQDAAAVPHIDLSRVAVKKPLNAILLRHEYDSANLALNTANYASGNSTTLTGVNKWSDHSGTSDPSADIEAAKEQVRSQIARRPNLVVLSAKAFNALKQHPKIIDRIKYTGRDSVTTDLLAVLWGVKSVVVGDSIFQNDSGALVDVWGGDVVVAFTEMGTLADAGMPSFGYTYQLRGYPLVEVAYQDRPAKSWVYPVTDERSPVIAASAAGFLIKAAA